MSNRQAQRCVTYAWWENVDRSTKVSPVDCRALSRVNTLRHFKLLGRVAIRAARWAPDPPDCHIVWFATHPNHCQRWPHWQQQLHWLCGCTRCNSRIGFGVGIGCDRRIGSAQHKKRFVLRHKMDFYVSGCFDESLASGVARLVVVIASHRLLPSGIWIFSVSAEAGLALSTAAQSRC